MYDYAYFYNLRTHAVITTVRIASYDLELLPYGKKLSTIRVKGRLELADAALVEINEYFFVLDSCVPNEDGDTTTVSMKPLYTIFDRMIPFVQQNTITDQIYTDIGMYFTNCCDPLFRYSWLTCEWDDSTLPYIRPAVDDTGRYNMADYLELVVETLYLSYSFTPAEIILSPLRRWTVGEGTAPIEARTMEYPLIYDCSTTKDVLLGASFSQDLISKITHYDPDNQTSTDYYLLSDGTVTTDGTDANRVEGRWIFYKAASVNSGLIAAQFARSRYSHSIAFLVRITDTIDVISVYRREPYYYGKCTIKLPSGAVIQSRITSVNARSGENKVNRLTAGKSLTTLNEIIQEVRNARN